MINISKALSAATLKLQNQTDSPQLDAELLLAVVLGKKRSFFYTHPEAILSKDQWRAFEQLINQRALGRPIAYLTGTREFWSFSLKVSEDTLIPRPETELLVELALKLLPKQRPAKLLDLGTGSGAIALALAQERPNWQITASDISQNALRVAKKNAALLNLTNVCFHHSDWFAKLAPSQKFTAIIANPPYIASNDPHLQRGDLRYEPSLALVGGSDGLSAIKEIISHSLARLEPGGLLLFEHGFDQKSAVRTMLNNQGYKKIRCWQDYQGHDRVSGGWRIIVAG